MPAYATVLGLWLVFYGQGIVNALRYLAGTWSPSPALTWSEALSRAADQLAYTAAAVWLVVLLASRFGLSRDQLGWCPTLPDRAGYRWQGQYVAFLYVGAIAASNAVSEALRRQFGGSTYPFRPASAARFLDAVTTAVAAGVVEELVLVAVLVGVLQAARQPVWRIYAVGMVLRWSFHIYYAGSWGLGLISTLPTLGWAAAAIALFRWTRRLTPLVAVHIVWDVFVGVTDNAGVWGQVVAITMAGAGMVVLLTWNDRRQRRSLRGAARRVQAILPDIAGRTGVPVPRLVLFGGGWPELYRGRRGVPVLRYGSGAVRKQTDDQVVGLLAHELQHLAAGDPVPSLAGLRLRSILRVVAGLALAVVGIVAVTLSRVPAPAPAALGLVAAGAGVVGLALCGASVLDAAAVRRRLRRTVDERWRRELAADRRAVEVVGLSTMRAAVKSLRLAPERGDPRARPLPPTAMRLQALTPAPPEAGVSRRPGRTTPQPRL